MSAFQCMIPNCQVTTNHWHGEVSAPASEPNEPMLVADLGGSKYERIAAEIGKLVTERNRTYGDSARGCDKIMAILYPDGIRPEQYRDALLVVRILDKLSRIAHGQRQDSYADIAGYAVLGEAMVREGHDANAR